MICIHLPLILTNQAQILCHVVSIDPCDPCVHDINARGDTRRRENIAVLDPTCFRYPNHIGPCRNRPGPGPFVGCGAAVVKNGGTREECGAGADGYDVFELEQGAIELSNGKKNRVPTGEEFTFG